MCVCVNSKSGRVNFREWKCMKTRGSCVSVRKYIASRTYWSCSEYYLQKSSFCQTRPINLFFACRSVSASQVVPDNFANLSFTFPQFTMEFHDYETINVSQIVANVTLIFILGKLCVSPRKKNEVSTFGLIRDENFK